MPPNSYRGRGEGVPFHDPNHALCSNGHAVLFSAYYTDPAPNAHPLSYNLYSPPNPNDYAHPDAFTHADLTAPIIGAAGAGGSRAIRG